MVERHKQGKRGKRGVDLMCEMFGGLVNAMEHQDADILGNVYQGSITHGEARQYFTPECVFMTPPIALWLIGQVG